MSRGTLGAVVGVCMVVAGLAWKIWATRVAVRARESAESAPGAPKSDD